MITAYQILRQRLQAELGHIEAAAAKAHHAYYDDTLHHLEAASFNLHSFYTGVERLLEWIARQIDNSVPQGGSWHRDLLTQMSLNLPGVRPAVLRPETTQLLQQYLGFRHVVRNLYSWEIDEERVAKLIALLPDTLRHLQQDILTFDQFLQTAHHADEM